MEHRGVVVLHAGGMQEETRDDGHSVGRRQEESEPWRRPRAVARPRAAQPVNFPGQSGARHASNECRYSKIRQQTWGHPINRQHHGKDRWYRGSHNQSKLRNCNEVQNRRGGMIPVAKNNTTKFSHQHSIQFGAISLSQWSHGYSRAKNRVHRGSNFDHQARHFESPRVRIPPNLVIPRDIVSDSPRHIRENSAPAEASLGKRWKEFGMTTTVTHPAKRARSLPCNSKETPEGRFDKLDLLCSATLELGPLQDNPSGCSCPKSKCIALYCDCFKAGRRCDPNTCTCLNCKNTLSESGPNGARSKAIQAILARNPRAFTNSGNTSSSNKPPPGGQACSCVRSRCLKLYCTCFQAGKACNPEICECVGCLNLKDDVGGHRATAIQATLEKRPDAFDKPKAKEIGSGCACKNNKCIRKYCECFRTKLACTKKCSCRDCQNTNSWKDRD